MSEGHRRPSLKVEKPRFASEWSDGEIVLYIEGLGQQRMRIYVGASEDITHVFIEHDDTMSVEVQEKRRSEIRWYKA